MMSRALVRVGIIGRGFGQRVVSRAYGDTEGCQVVDVVSPRDEGAVAALCARADIDLITVHSPPFLHLDHVRRAVEAGHAVVCDKPFGRNANDTKEMCRLAEEAGVVNVANLENRFDPARSRLRALVREGHAGTPENFQCTYIMNISRVPLRPYGWLFDADLGGGWLRSIGSHQIDFFRWTFGDVVDAVGYLRTAIRERPDAGGTLHRCTADDAFTALLRSANGVTAMIESTFAAVANLTPTILVIGDEAVLELVADQRIMRHTEAGQQEEFAVDIGGTAKLYYENQLLYNMRTFATVVCDAVRAGRVEAGVGGSDLATFSDALPCVEVMDRLHGRV
jgi:predicted dehydrogenase